MTTNTNKIKRKKKQLGNYPYPTVIFSITMALSMMGLFALLLSHAGNLSKVIKEKFELQVYLNNNLSDNKKISLTKIISLQPYVLKKDNVPLVTFISQEDAAKAFIEETGEDFHKILGSNPLHASIALKIRPDFTDSLELIRIKEQLLKMDGVFEVEYKENLISQINKNVKAISVILLGFSIILILASILLINNTLKLALFSQRFLIRSMQLVGAKTSFIKWPFLKHAILHGLMSGLFASAILIGLLHFTYQEIPELEQLRDIESIILIFISIIITGVLLGFFSTLSAMNKYLKMSLDELY